MSGATVTRLSPRETAGVVADVVAPLLARGVIVRRPPGVAALDRIDGDRRAEAGVERIRGAHGPGAVVLAIPGRDMALVLSAADVHRVLDGSPEPFATANAEKVAAPAHF